MSSKEFILLEKHEASLSRSKKKHYLYRLAVANKDVGAAEDICNAYIGIILGKPEGMEPMPYHVNEAFFLAIVTSYARPFQNNDSNLKLPKKWERFSTKQMQDTHNQMLQLRDEIYAHSDAAIHPMKIYPAGYYSQKLGRVIPRTSMEIEAITLSPQSVMDFRAVCKDLHERLETEVFLQIDRLYGGMDLPSCPFPLRIHDEGL